MDRRSLLPALYAQTPLTVDELPYTEDFEHMLTVLQQKLGQTQYPREVLGDLLYLRKRGLLVRKHRAA